MLVILVFFPRRLVSINRIHEKCLDRLNPGGKFSFNKQPFGPPPEVTKNSYAFSDTACTLDVGVSNWEAMYNLFEDEGPKFTERIVTAEDRVFVSQITYSDVDNSFLHRIGTHPRFLPYMDMIRWVIDHMNIADRNFMT